MRSRAHRAFALFAFLVAGNFLAQFFIGAFGAGYGSDSYYGRLALLFLTFDPAALALFASLYPYQARFLRRRASIAAFFAIPVVLAIVQFVDVRLVLPGSRSAWIWLLYLYLAAAYLYGLLRYLWLSLSVPTSILRQQSQILLVAFGIALIPRIGLLVIDLPLGESLTAAQATFIKIVIAWGLLATLAGMAALLGAAGERRTTLAALAAIVPFLALFTAIWILELRDVAGSLFWVSLGWGSRWIVFSAIAGFAMARFRLLDYRPHWRSTAAMAGAFVAVVAVLFVVPGFAIEFPSGGAGGQDLRLSNIDVGLILFAAVAIASAPLVFPLLRRFASRPAADGSSGGELRQERRQAYRAVLETLHAQGLRDPNRPELRRLRRSLGITPREHESLATLVEWQRAARDPDEVESPLASYEVLRPLGEGSWGQAFLARERSTGRHLVLKRLHASARDDPTARERLLREARVLLRIRDGHVVDLLKVIEEPDPILVLEYVAGGSLEDRLRSRTRMSLFEARDVFRDVLAGLDAIHRIGVVHRDLKPANVLLTPQGRAKICDFGIALPADLQKTVRSQATAADASGTLLFMAPEQARGERLDARSDLYSVGAILYRALAGRPHVDLAGRSEVEARRILGMGPACRAIVGQPAGVNEFLRKALAADGRNRFRSARDMARRLSGLLDAPVGPPRKAVAQGARARRKPATHA